MRYYILCDSDYPDVSPYILAEVVRDALESGDDRQTSLAAGLVGELAQILTRAELLASQEGRTALAAWDLKEDTSFNLENRHIRNELELDLLGRHLRLVDDGERLDPAASSDSRRRHVLIRALGLRELSRRLQEENRVRRQELEKGRRKKAKERRA